MIRTHPSLFVYPLVSATVIAILGGLLPLRATWGKQCLGGFRIFVIKLLALTLVVVIGVLAIVLAAPTSFAPLILVTVLAVAAVGLVLVMGSAVSMVYSTAAYRHVTHRPVTGFEALDLVPRAVVSGLA